jgi:hypothetical protein
VLLEYVRTKRLRHVDVVVYVTLAYFRWRFRGDRDDGAFYVTKSELRECAGVDGVVESIERLYRGFAFTGGAHLFEYQHGYHKLMLSAWGGFADPSQDDAAKEQLERRRTTIDRRICDMRTAKLKPKRNTKRTVRK